MVYSTIAVRETAAMVTLTLNRPSARNSINTVMLREINEVLDAMEQVGKAKILVLEGQPGFFCTGMDFNEVVAGGGPSGSAATESFTRQYIATLRRFSLLPFTVISVVDGQVLAGGVGLAAASDFVIATPRSEFSLSEAIWGLLPSMVIPFLIRRTGFQKAYTMTLTTMPVSSVEAREAGLVDELSSEPKEVLQRLTQRLFRIDTATIGEMKRYFRQMWIINEQMEKAAADETFQLVSSEKVQRNIYNYVHYRKFPWDE